MKLLIHDIDGTSSRRLNEWCSFGWGCRGPLYHDSNWPLYSTATVLTVLCNCFVSLQPLDWQLLFNKYINTTEHEKSKNKSPEACNITRTQHSNIIQQYIHTYSYIYSYICCKNTPEMHTICPLPFSRRSIMLSNFSDDTSIFRCFTCRFSHCSSSLSMSYSGISWSMPKAVANSNTHYYTQFNFINGSPVIPTLIRWINTTTSSCSKQLQEEIVGTTDNAIASCIHYQLRVAAAVAWINHV